MPLNRHSPTHHKKSPGMVSPSPSSSTSAGFLCVGGAAAPGASSSTYDQATRSCVSAAALGWAGGCGGCGTSSSSSQYASALNFMGAATGAVSCGSTQNMRRDSAKAKVSRQLATGRRRSALEPRRGMVLRCLWQLRRVASEVSEGVKRREAGPREFEAIININKRGRAQLPTRLTRWRSESPPTHASGRASRR